MHVNEWMVELEMMKNKAVHAEQSSYWYNGVWIEILRVLGFHCKWVMYSQHHWCEGRN